MAINAMIPLQAQAGDPLNALAKGYQLGNTIRQQPMVDQMNQQKLQAGQMELDQQKMKMQEMAKDSRIKSAVMGAAELQSAPVEQWTSILQDRIQGASRYAYDASAEKEALQILQTKGPEALKAQVDGLVKFGSMAGLLGGGGDLRQQEIDLRRQALQQSASQFEAQMRLRERELNAPRAEPDPYYSIVETTQGKMIMNSRTGKLEPAFGPDGKPLLSPATDPDNKRNVNAAAAFGTEQGKNDAEAIGGLGGAISKAETALSRISEMRNHEGRSLALGYASMLPGVPGTKQMDFIKRLEELKGGAFLQAFESLKGGGQITQIEGDKATAAITRMDRALSPQDFDQALSDFEEVVKVGMERAKASAAKSSNRQDQPAPISVSPAPSASQIQEGATATNPQTGQRIIFRGGQWQTM